MSTVIANTSPTYNTTFASWALEQRGQGGGTLKISAAAGGRIGSGGRRRPCCEGRSAAERVVRGPEGADRQRNMKFVTATRVGLPFILCWDSSLSLSNKTKNGQCLSRRATGIALLNVTMVYRCVICNPCITACQGQIIIIYTRNYSAALCAI